MLCLKWSELKSMHGDMYNWVYYLLIFLFSGSQYWLRTFCCIINQCIMPFVAMLTHWSAFTLGCPMRRTHTIEKVSLSQEILFTSWFDHILMTDDFLHSTTHNIFSASISLVGFGDDTGFTTTPCNGLLLAFSRVLWCPEPEGLSKSAFPLASFQTKSPWVSGNYSRVIETVTFTAFSFFRVSNDCTEYASLA